MGLFDAELLLILWAYAKGFVGTRELKEWLAQNIWGLSESPSPLDRMAAGELEIALAEFDRGDRGEEHVRQTCRFLALVMFAVRDMKYELPEVSELAAA